MKTLLVTNNPMVNKEILNFNILYLEDKTYLELLLKIRDFVHKGYTLLTHPLTSSIKPNETPFKSILIQEGNGEINFSSLELIENALSLLNSFKKNIYIKQYSQKIIEDFQLIDYSVIKSGIENTGGKRL